VVNPRLVADNLADELDVTDENDVRLRVSVAGVTCVGWSNEGLQERGAHPSEKANIIHNKERFKKMDNWLDIGFGECTAKYPAMERGSVAFEGQGTVLSIVDGPELHGWPCKRMRVLWAVLNNATCKWVGPQDFESDFKRRFHRSIIIGGEKLLRSTQAEVHAEYELLARDRKHNLKAADINEMSSSSLLEQCVAWMLGVPSSSRSSQNRP